MAVIIPILDTDTPANTNVDRPQAWGYDGVIGTNLIRLGVSDETPIEDLTADVSPQKIDTSESSEDIRDEIGRRYSRSDLSGGAGLDFLHSPKRPDDAATRFWDSAGIDVFSADRGEPYTVKLMKRLTKVVTSAFLRSVVEVAGKVYYLDSSAGIYEWDGTTSTLKYSVTTGYELLTAGNALYLRGTHGVDRFYPELNWTPTVVTAVSYQSFWYVKGRIVGCNSANILVDENANVLITLPTSEHFTDVVDVGPAILAFTTAGDVHALALNESLELVTAGQSHFTGETPVLASMTQGVIGIVTTTVNDQGGYTMRFYTASLDLSGSYSLGDIQLIFQSGDRSGTPSVNLPQFILPTRDSFYIAFIEDAYGPTTIWRYYLPTGGYARSYEPEFSSGVVRGMCIVDDQMYAVDTAGLYVEDGKYVNNGWFIGPIADFYTADDKQWISSELIGTRPHVDNTLLLYVTNDVDLDNASWTFVTALEVGATKATADAYDGELPRYHAARVIWNSEDDKNDTCTFQACSFRGLPSPDRDTLIRIPINVSDQIDSPGKRSINVPGRGQAIEDALRAYEGVQTTIDLYRPDMTIRGVVEKFERTITSIPKRGSSQRIMYARIRGTLVTS